MLFTTKSKAFILHPKFSQLNPFSTIIRNHKARPLHYTGVTHIHKQTHNQAIHNTVQKNYYQSPESEKVSLLMHKGRAASARKMWKKKDFGNLLVWQCCRLHAKCEFGRVQVPNYPTVRSYQVKKVAYVVPQNGIYYLPAKFYGNPFGGSGVKRSSRSK